MQGHWLTCNKYTHNFCQAIGDWLYVPIATDVAALVVVGAVILAFIWMEPSGDGELNQIFMIAKKGNIKLYEPTSSTTVYTHTHTYCVVGNRERETYNVLVILVF